MRLLLMDVISRFVGYHKLCLFPFYAFLQSYLTAHQQQVTRIRFFLGIETRIEEDEEKEKEIKVDEIDQHAYPHTPPLP